MKKIPFWRNSRTLGIIAQIVIVAIVLAIFIYLGSNLINNFRRLGLNFGFNFLTRPTSFNITNIPIEFSPTDPYIKAILIGVINSLKVMFFGIILATILGITVGIARLSNNWLVQKLASIYVETLRNTPLLLQLFFWYFAVFLKLPRVENAVSVNNLLFLSNRGLNIPWFVNNEQTGLSFILIVIAIALAIFFWQRRIKAVEEGASGNKWLYFLIANLVIAIAVFLFGIDWNLPQYADNSITGGANLSPEFATLLIGLSVYTASFIAEVVRAGIQSVSKGQSEAAKALGLKPALVMQLVIFPQALRVMIPPLTSEFLNLAKNSSLAIAIGYNDVYAISNTISNQTGKAVEILLILVSIYLIINLIISLAMNWLNKSVQLKER